MSIGLLITALVAMFVASSPSLMGFLFGTPFAYAIMFAPLVMVMMLSWRINSMSAQSAQIMFYSYAAVMGASLALIFYVYTSESIARVFLISASVFGALSLYGYTTKKDLTSIGTFLYMTLIGIIIASIVNIFLKSSQMQFLLSILSVVVFMGLTAYDTQKLKDQYYMLGNGSVEVAKKVSIIGALTLYLDFINLFMHLLYLFGQRRD